jgi:hypothetical protein
MNIKSLLRVISKNIYVLVIVTIVIALYFNFNKSTQKEGFSNSMSYNKCINSGYSKEFCVQTPTSVLGPAGCLTPDGRVGYRLPGFRGRCVVNDELDNDEMISY